MKSFFNRVLYLVQGTKCKEILDVCIFSLEKLSVLLIILVIIREPLAQNNS